MRLGPKFRDPPMLSLTSKWLCRRVNRAFFSTTAARKTFKLREAPHPTWELGSGLPQSESKWREEGEAARKVWDLNVTSPMDVYKLLTSAIIPRPIALVSSISHDGIPNLAPMSYFSMVSHHPPLVSVSLSLSARKPKDTRENILATKQFTVSIVSEPFAEAVNATAVEAPAHVDEWIVSGLSMEKSIDVKPAFVKESAVSLECELYSSQDVILPDSTTPSTTIVLGLVKKVHVRPSVLRHDGKQIDPGKLRAIGRMGGATYGRVTDGFDLPRISWKKHGDDIGELLKAKKNDH